MSRSESLASHSGRRFRSFGEFSDHLKEKEIPGLVITMGNFDGVHFGHLKVFKEAKELANQLGVPWCVMTFRPHPKEFLSPEATVEFILTYDEKADRIFDEGTDYYLEQPFDHEFSQFRAQEFMKKVLVESMHVRGIVVGYDFCFGQNREGNPETLTEFGKNNGIEVRIVSALDDGDQIISSSRIRPHLKNGEVDAASQLLGYPFFVQGHVKEGDQRGRKVGFPTANLLPPDQKIRIANGVYATWASVDGGERMQSVTNVGVRPTFEQKVNRVWIECHLLDREMDLYGKKLKLEFMQQIRAERKFSGIDELKKQIARDCESAKEALSGKEI